MSEEEFQRQLSTITNEELRRYLNSPAFERYQKVKRSVKRLSEKFESIFDVPVDEFAEAFANAKPGDPISLEAALFAKLMGEEEPEEGWPDLRIGDVSFSDLPAIEVDGEGKDSAGLRFVSRLAALIREYGDQPIEDENGNQLTNKITGGPLTWKGLAEGILVLSGELSNSVWKGIAAATGTEEEYLSWQNTLSEFASLTGAELDVAVQQYAQENGLSNQQTRDLILVSTTAVVAAGAVVGGRRTGVTNRIVPDETLDQSDLNRFSQVRGDLRLTSNNAQRRNVAFGEGNVDGVDLGEVLGVSGRYRNQGVPLPENRIFTTTVDGHTRHLDSEVYVLENIAQRLTPNSTGTIRLVSERTVCNSCQGVIRQFRERFPNVILIVRAGSE